MGFRLRLSIGRQNVRETLKIAGTAITSWLFPVDNLSSVARIVRRARDRGSTRSRQIDLIVARILSGRITKKRACEIDFDWRARILEARMQVLALHRPGRLWQPKIKIYGLEHLESALQGRSGIVIWISDFVYSSLITKMAFCRAGYEVSHLTRPGHGFLSTRYGVRVLNPLWTKIEDRFIAERISIERGETATALELIRNRLAANKIVSITVGSQGRRTVDVPFFNGGIRLATGPVHLCQTCHAALLPVFTVRSGDEYEVSIDPAINQLTHFQDYESIVRLYVKSLEKYVLTYPGQWNGWMRNVKREEAEIGLLNRIA